LCSWRFYTAGGRRDVIYRLATVLSFFAIGARRLYDSGRSGWWLIGVVAFSGVVWFVALYCPPSGSDDWVHPGSSGEAEHRRVASVPLD
jgi:hypothetical protein